MVLKMKKVTHWLMMVVVLFAYLTLGESISQDRKIVIKKRGVALVIGNGAYKTSPLKNPVNDAHDIAQSLQQMGFQVIYNKNADQRTMEKAISNFGKQLRNGGVGLFYFAGHGVQSKGHNYLIPIGAEIESESDVKYKAIDAGIVLGKMEDARNDLNIVILDACRNNPFAQSFRSTSFGLARMDAPKGSMIAYATAPGSVAADGVGRNGIYTKHLLKHMKEPGLKIEEVLKKVRIDVMDETEEKQIPWESTSLRGDFYFNPKTNAAIVKKQPPAILSIIKSFFENPDNKKAAFALSVTYYENGLGYDATGSSGMIANDPYATDIKDNNLRGARSVYELDIIPDHIWIKLIKKADGYIDVADLAIGKDINYSRSFSEHEHVKIPRGLGYKIIRDIYANNFCNKTAKQVEVRVPTFDLQLSTKNVLYIEEPSDVTKRVRGEDPTPPIYK